MSSITTPATSCATGPKPPFSIDHQNAPFAGRVQRANFNIKALNQNSPENRAPEPGPRPLDEVAAEVAKRAGQASLAYWLRKAAKARNVEDREAALETAHEVARLLGFTNAAFLDRAPA